MLVTAARIQNVHNVIAPALRENKVVICDRYVDSTRVYQGRALSENYVEQFLNPSDFPYPDITLLLTCDCDVIKERIKENIRGKKDRFDHMVDLQKNIQEQFIKLADKFPNRIKTLDTTGLTPEQVLESALELINLDKDKQTD